MSEIVDCLKNDLSDFDTKIIDLSGQRETLTKQINDIDANLKNIEPLRAYAESLLKRAQQKPVSKKGSSKTSPLA